MMSLAPLFSIRIINNMKRKKKNIVYLRFSFINHEKICDKSFVPFFASSSSSSLAFFCVCAHICPRIFFLLFCRTSAISSENNFTEMKFRLPKCFRLLNAGYFFLSLSTRFFFKFYFILCLLLLWRNDLNQFYYFIVSFTLELFLIVFLFQWIWTGIFTVAVVVVDQKEIVKLICDALSHRHITIHCIVKLKMRKFPFRIKFLLRVKYTQKYEKDYMPNGMKWYNWISTNWNRFVLFFFWCTDGRQGKANNFIIIVKIIFIIIIKITSDTMESTSGSSVNSKSNSPKYW